jgi:hypothetical protein
MYKQQGPPLALYSLMPKLDFDSTVLMVRGNNWILILLEMVFFYEDLVLCQYLLANIIP